MDLLKAIAQFLVVLVVGYLVAVAASCAWAAVAPPELAAIQAQQHRSWQSAPEASRHDQSFREQLEHGLQTVRAVTEKRTS